MKIAVLNETSSADRNGDILEALSGRGHDIINCGMTRSGATAGGGPELAYLHTALMSALLLRTGRADFGVGGCGTGQGYLNAALQYPGVFCGRLESPLDAFLFARINGGNCVSLALNQGYGWAGNVNLRMLFDALFTDERGQGYPAHRQVPQREARLLLGAVSELAHRPMEAIVAALPDAVVAPALRWPGFAALLFSGPVEEPDRKSVV